MIKHGDDAHEKGGSSLEKLMLALQEETTSKQQRQIDFEEAYPALEHHLSRKVPVKVVLAKFNAVYGYGIHPPAFRKLLEAERKRRADAGKEAVCTGCGQALGGPGNAGVPGDTVHEEDAA